jgi:uncharacterized membrane protein HdeD (DUF308 family)
MRNLWSSTTSSLIWRAVLAIIVGVIAIAWPGITVGAFVILFAVYAFIAAATEFSVAFGANRGSSVAGHLLLGFVDVAAAVIALAWPGITALALVTVLAVWAFVIGVMEIAFAFQSGETAGERALLGLTGLVSIALAVVFAARPDVGAVTVAEVYGLFSFVSGVSSFVVAMNMRRLGNAVSPVAKLAA